MTSILFGGRLVALNKKSGGICPIVSGFTLRRLASKCANSFAVSKRAPYFAPRQMGAGVEGGCYSAVHATRRFLGSLQPKSVIVKLDFSNVFNFLHRNSMLEAVFSINPGYLPLLSFSIHPLLWFDEDVIWSEEGPQQGDSLGSLLFCLTVQPLLNSLQSLLVAVFTGDFTLGGPEDVVDQDIFVVTSTGTSLGLHLNVATCELVHPQGSAI